MASLFRTGARKLSVQRQLTPSSLQPPNSPHQIRRLTLQSCPFHATTSPRILPRATPWSVSGIAIRRNATISQTWQPAPNTPTSKKPSPPPEANTGVLEAGAQSKSTDSEKRDIPSYEITFTCNPCSTRSTHRISKQGYHHGTVLITCPNCKARHLISDHLKIFKDKATTIEDILRDKGQNFKKGIVSPEGGVEFWDDAPAPENATEKGD